MLVFLIAFAVVALVWGLPAAIGVAAVMLMAWIALALLARFVRAFL